MGKICVMTLLYPILSVCARFLWLLKPVGMSICYAFLCAKFEFLNLSFRPMGKNSLPSRWLNSVNCYEGIWKLRVRASDAFALL